MKSILAAVALLASLLSAKSIAAGATTTPCDAPADACVAGCPRPGADAQSGYLSRSCVNQCASQWRACEWKLPLAGRAASPFCASILTWAERVSQEHPGTDLYRMPGDRLHRISLPLFADESFLPVFGVAFDQSTVTQRWRIGVRMQNCFTGPDRAMFTWQSTLARPFLGVDAAEQGFISVAASTGAMRTARAELSQLRRALAAIPATVEAFEEFSGMTARLDGLSSRIWPSEKSAIVAEISTARQRAAGPALVAEIDRLTAQAHGYDGLLRLREGLARQKAIVAVADESTVQRVRERIAQRTGELLSELMPHERGRIAALGDDLGALERGRLWQIDFRARYLNLFEDASVRDVYGTYQKWRIDRLVALRPHIEASIKAETRIEGMDRFISAHLAEVDELGHPLATALAQTAAARRQALVVQRDLAANFSERERRLMTAEPGRVIVPTRPDPPTPQEIRFAFVREMEAIGMRRTGGESFDWAIPFPVLQGASARVVLEDVQVQSCVRETPGNTFQCAYRLKLRMTPGEAMSRFFGDSLQGQMLNALYDSVSNAPPVLQHDRLILRDSGWRSDTIREKGVKGVTTMIQTTAENASQALDSVGRGLRCANARMVDRALGVCP
jgi:hypothetical protein